jgi:hypothetical protein
MFALPVVAQVLQQLRIRRRSEVGQRQENQQDRVAQGVAAS